MKRSEDTDGIIFKTVEADRIFDFSYSIYIGPFDEMLYNKMGERTYRQYDRLYLLKIKIKLMEILQVAYVIFSLSSTTREGSSPREICFTN